MGHPMIPQSGGHRGVRGQRKHPGGISLVTKNMGRLDSRSKVAHAFADVDNETRSSEVGW